MNCLDLEKEILNNYNDAEFNNNNTKIDKILSILEEKNNDKMIEENKLLVYNAKNKLKLFVFASILSRIKYKPDDKIIRFIIPLKFNKNIIDELFKDFFENNILLIKYVNLDKNNNPNSFDLEYVDKELFLDYLIKNLK